MSSVNGPNRIHITNVKITAIGPDPAKGKNDTIYWDNKLSGFGVKITPAGNKSFIYQYRPRSGGDIKRFRIGRAGEGGMAAIKARRTAEQLRSDVANGGDPQKEKMDAKNKKTLSELCRWFLDKDCPLQIKSNQLTASTVESSYKPRLRYVLEDRLANRAAESITPTDIEGFKSRLLNRKKMSRRKDGNQKKSKVANNTLSIDSVNTCLRTLHRVYERARIVGIILCNNPTRGMKQFTSTAVENYLEDEEITRLSDVLRKEETSNPVGVNIIRMALLTGARRNEINHLKWDEIDRAAGVIRREDHKNKRRDHGKPRIIIITDAVGEILNQARAWEIDGNPHVFPAQYHRSVVFQHRKTTTIEPVKGPYGGLVRFWQKIRKLAGIEGKRFHDLRHSVGALAISGGLSLSETGKLLGHKSIATTARYAHVNRASHKRAAEAISVALESLTGTAPPRDVVIDFKRPS